MTKSLEPRPPAELAYITDVIGAEATLRLIEEMGGTEVYVTKDPNQGSNLALAVGLGAAQALADAFGGIILRVPLAKAWRIHLYRWRGETYPELARRFTMTEEGIRRALRGSPDRGTERTRSEQPDLFGG